MSVGRERHAHQRGAKAARQGAQARAMNFHTPHIKRYLGDSSPAAGTYFEDSSSYLQDGCPRPAFRLLIVLVQWLARLDGVRKPATCGENILAGCQDTARQASGAYGEGFHHAWRHLVVFVCFLVCVCVLCFLVCLFVCLFFLWRKAKSSAFQLAPIQSRAPGFDSQDAR